jgi:hypothetical protein
MATTAAVMRGVILRGFLLQPSDPGLIGESKKIGPAKL